MPEWLVLSTAAMALVGQTVALIVGMSRFKVWLTKAVIDPYIKPIKDDQAAMKVAAEADHTMLIEHDRYIYLLLGKNFSMGDSSAKAVNVDISGLIEQISREKPA